MMKGKRILILLLAAVILTGVTFMIFAGGSADTDGSDQAPAGTIVAGMTPENAETAVFAGGCFWGVEAVFEHLNGVAEVKSGYSGGEAETAHYNMIGWGTTGHAESVEIIFDPSIISYETLLDVFFTVAHDPTQLNFQGPDVGSQYRSAVFYLSDEQKRTVEEYIQKLGRSGKYSGPIVTEVVPLTAFYLAEEYHQDFMSRNPQHPYIVYWDQPKIAHLEKEFPDLLARR